MISRNLLVFLTVLLACLPASMLRAEDSSSLWTLHLAYHEATAVVSTGSEVYALLNGNLLAYDTEAEEVRTIEKTDGLSDKGISYIGYSDSQDCLVLYYENNNIDLLYADGTVVNIPQVKNYSDYDITASNLNVYNEWAVVSTTQGIILIDLEKEEIKAYYNFDRAVKDAIVLDDLIYMALSDVIMVGTMTDNLYDFSSWEWTYGATVTAFIGIEDCAYAIVPYVEDLTESRSGLCFLSEENEYGARTLTRVTSETVLSASVCDDQLVCLTSSSLLFADFDAPFELTERALPSTVSQAVAVAATSDGSYWLAEGSEGVCGYELRSEALSSTDVSLGGYGPRRDYAYSLDYFDEVLYVCGGELDYRGQVFLEGTIMRFDGTTWEAFEDDFDSEVDFVNVLSVAQDPADADHFYAASYGTGLYEFSGTSFVALHSDYNSPLVSTLPSSSNHSSYVRLGGAAFDANGNLWVTNNGADSTFVILLADGTWAQLYAQDLAGGTSVEKVYFGSDGTLWVNVRFDTSAGAGGLYGLNFNATPEDPDDDEEEFRDTATNEDGTSCDFGGVKAICEDRDGQIWFGTEAGVFAVTDPDEWFSSSFTVYQPKVPRNDGTNYADYLLTGVTVSAIAVDGGNRKWLGTTGSGIYLVNEDGSEVLDHFTADDSPLLSDNIYALAIHPSTGELMIGTEEGLCSYRSGVTNPATTLKKSNIKVYPNPVRPSYSGNVTITGLTEDAEIKILSAGGQLVRRGTATGGSFLWDVTNASGNRVPTGVYFIMVANADGSASVAAKVAVI